MTFGQHRGATRSGERSTRMTREYWRAELVRWLTMKDDLSKVTVADMPSWIKRLPQGEPEEALKAEIARRADRDAA